MNEKKTVITRKIIIAKKCSCNCIQKIKQTLYETIIDDCQIFKVTHAENFRYYNIQ